MHNDDLWQLFADNDIEGLGTFLIVEGDDPQLNFVTDTLGVQNPEIIKVSFDNL